MQDFPQKIVKKSSYSTKSSTSSFILSYSQKFTNLYQDFDLGFGSEREKVTKGWNKPNYCVEELDKLIDFDYLRFSQKDSSDDQGVLFEKNEKFIMDY